VQHVEPAVSQLGLPVHANTGRRVSHSHGITLAVRWRTLPCSAAARRSAVSLVPRGGTTERRPT